MCFIFFFQAEDGIRDLVRSRGLGDVYKRQVMPLINKLKHKNGFTVKVLGKSVEGRELKLITIGKGKTKIFMWSQMHGDEPTATAALFDIINFINDPANKDFCKGLFDRVTLYFLPMVNPDGAERFKRRNFYDIDLNRDASRLQCPEAIILKSVFDSLKADFGFNLHDQSHRYSVGNSFRTATISFLAPAYNYEKEFNDVRINACLLYTSDAADERSSVDLGGRRIIKKKNIEQFARDNRHRKRRYNMYAYKA